MLKFGKLLLLLALLMVFVVGCVPSAVPEGEGSSSIMPMIIFLVIIFAAFYFLTIRPQRRKQKQHEELVQELQKGDRVITAGGIYGQIESMNEESIVLKIESGSTIRIARPSVIGKRER